MVNRFDDWTDVVDCNECKHYWDDSCDGVSKGHKRRCTSFEATKMVDIPLKIEKLQRDIETFKTRIIISGFIDGFVIGALVYLVWRLYLV